MRCQFVMFVTADGVLFLLKLKWPKNNRSVIVAISDFTVLSILPS